MEHEDKNDEVEDITRSIRSDQEGMERSSEFHRGLDEGIEGCGGDLEGQDRRGFGLGH